MQFYGLSKLMKKSKPEQRSNLGQRFGWTKTSYVFMSAFVLLLFIIGYVWWPLVEEYLASYDPAYSFWVQFDWLLLANFLVMSLLIMSGADLKKDLPIILVGFVGGLVIESWGTQTNLWFYYTFERPPLWIIPAWPIASLSIDRIFRWLKSRTLNVSDKVISILYWLVFPVFLFYMLSFVWPTINQSLTLMAIFLCVFLILTPVNKRAMLLTFIAGSSLGYFLELWGTTRYCWIYYTMQTPPFFAILAHGMAAVAFWRVAQLFPVFLPHISRIFRIFVRFNQEET